jgi:hypothetical protein
MNPLSKTGATIVVLALAAYLWWVAAFITGGLLVAMR